MATGTLPFAFCLRCAGAQIVLSSLTEAVQEVFAPWKSRSAATARVIHRLRPGLSPRWPGRIFLHARSPGIDCALASLACRPLRSVPMAKKKIRAKTAKRKSATRKAKIGVGHPATVRSSTPRPWLSHPAAKGATRHDRNYPTRINVGRARRPARDGSGRCQARRPGRRRDVSLKRARRASPMPLQTARPRRAISGLDTRWHAQAPKCWRPESLRQEASDRESQGGAMPLTIPENGVTHCLSPVARRPLRAEAG